jgi:isochorismate synthase
MSSRKAKLESLVETARARAQSSGRRVLVSLTEKIDTVDPILVVESFADGASSSDGSRDLIAAGRMYWERAADSFAMAGIGAAATFEYSGARRFAATDTEWQALLDEAIVESDAPGSLAAGPLLMGGFAFEPNGPRTTLWRGFKSSHLIIPALLVTSVSEQSWITLNIIVSERGEPGFDPAALVSIADSVMQGTREDFSFRGSGETDVDQSSMSARGEWLRLVESAVAEIRAGLLEKVVVARGVRIFTPDPIDVFAVLRHLRSVYSQSFVFGVWSSDRAFVGATPERLVRLNGREVEASSLAGTIERGATPLEDAANREQLRKSAKDLAEHSAVRNELFAALSETCDDVRAANEPSLLTLPHVHHLHTSLRARLRDKGSLLGLVAQLHPTPAVGGSPREAALEFIRDHENLDRGWYAAPVGWIGGQGGEFAVALRSALIDDDTATLFAGCGIVADSNPDLEYEESNLKLQAMHAAIASAVASSPASLEMTTASEPIA